MLFGSDEDLLFGIEEVQAFFGDFISVLVRTVILKVPVSLFNLTRDVSVFFFKFFKAFLEEEVLIERVEEAECHDADDWQSDEQRQLFADGFRVLVWHEGSIEE